MSKKRVAPQPGSSGSSPLLWILVALVVINGVVTFGNFRQIQRVVSTMESRFLKVEGRVADMQVQVAEAAKKAQAPQPQRRGPDPERVYALKLDGAPVKGPADAPITIYEVSDFQ